MPEIVVTAPTAEPIDLLEAKVHLRVTDSAQDSRITSYIKTARHAAERETRRTLLHTRYQYVLDAFPQGGFGTPLPFSDTINVPRYAIVLPRNPVVRVISIQYTDMAGSTQTMPATDYVTNLAILPGLITPGFGKVWPIAIPQIGAVTVTFDAGHASPVTFSGNNITVLGPVTWSVNDRVRFSNSGGALPLPLAPMTDYYILTANAGVYTISATQGGTVIPLGVPPPGTSYIGEVPAGILEWMQIRVGSLYDSREEIAVLQRGSIQEIPFFDGLLDDHRIVT